MTPTISVQTGTKQKLLKRKRNKKQKRKTLRHILIVNNYYGFEKKFHSVKKALNYTLMDILREYLNNEELFNEVKLSKKLVRDL